MCNIKKEQTNTLLNHENYKTYTLEYFMQQSQNISADKPGSSKIYHDTIMETWRMTIQLEEERVWFLSVFINEDNTLNKFSLDKELASDSHYEFKAEAEIRKELFQKGDEEKFLHEILIAFLKNQSGEKLLAVLRPYITAQYHFD